LWSLIGSANLDPRSLRLNFELDLQVYDAELARRLSDHFDERFARAVPVTLPELEARPLPVRPRDGIAQLASPYLHRLCPPAGVPRHQVAAVGEHGPDRLRRIGHAPEVEGAEAVASLVGPVVGHPPLHADLSGLPAQKELLDHRHAGEGPLGGDAVVVLAEVA